MDHKWAHKQCFTHEYETKWPAISNQKYQIVILIGLCVILISSSPTVGEAIEGSMWKDCIMQNCSPLITPQLMNFLIKSELSIEVIKMEQIY